MELEDDKTSAGGKQQEDSQPPASNMAGQENGDGDARSEAADEKGAAAGEKGEAVRKEREWVPLVHAPANGEWPAVLIRQPLQSAAPPTPPTEWRVGERVEVSQHPSTHFKSMLVSSLQIHRKKNRIHLDA